MTFADVVQNAAGVGAIIASLTFLVGSVTLLKTLIEYRNQISMKRFEKFQEMRNRFNQSKEIQTICFLLENDDPQLREIHFTDKRTFLGFYEEIALMQNSGLLKKAVAHYMFGYYAIRCYQSENFWNWPAPGFEDTEFGVLMEPEVDHGEAEVYAGVQA